MANVTLTRNTTLPDESQKGDFHNLVDTATGTVSGIVNADISASAAIDASKLSLSTVTQNIAHSGTMTHSGVVTMSGKAFNEAKGADIASAATTTIWATDGNLVHVTGTTTITSFGTAAQAGIERVVVFDGALTLTHNSTSLILPTGASITTAAGDVAIVRAETTANARVVAYMKASGAALASSVATGQVVQVVSTNVTAAQSITTQIPYDDTIPQNTEGDQILSLAITPSASANKLLIIANAFWGQSTGGTNVSGTMALFQDSTASALAANAMYTTASSTTGHCVLTHYMTAGTTSATTFKVRLGPDAGITLTLNGIGGSRKLGGIASTNITIMEIKG